MTTQLTDDQIKELHARHHTLCSEIRVALGRLEILDDVIRDRALPAGKSFADIGTPLKERPA